MRKLAIKSKHGRYSVAIGRGLLPTLSKLLRSADLDGPYFVVTSPKIWALWGDSFRRSFRTEPLTLFVPDGEQHKTLAALEKLARELTAAGAKRNANLIAFGGGVIGDLTGMLAATYMRGVAYAQVPTTLVAQMDASIGGKTGVNLPEGKNLLGSFYPPRIVVADTTLLSTLPRAELRAGLYECVKTAIIGDAKLFKLLERAGPALLDTPAALDGVVYACAKIKARIVARDEHDKGPRMLLNFGHTFGHAIESAHGYSSFLHGEAVALGMLAAIQIAGHRASLSAPAAARMRALILSYGPLPRVRATTNRLLASLAHDKKDRKFVLPRRIGHATIVNNVSASELRSAALALRSQS